MAGVMEDTGDTWPVCDTCGHIGTSRTRDGDPCPVCEEDDFLQGQLVSTDEGEE